MHQEATHLSQPLKSDQYIILMSYKLNDNNQLFIIVQSNVIISEESFQIAPLYYIADIQTERSTSFVTLTFFLFYGNIVEFSIYY